MAGLKIMVGLWLIAASWAFAYYWSIYQQPAMANDVALKQLEVHRDGQGDRLAAERHALTQAYHWPRDMATAVTGLVLVALVWSEAQKLFNKDRKGVQSR